MPLYIEHGRPFGQGSIKRYDDLHAAATNIAQSSRHSVAMILADLRARGRFCSGGDWWAIATPQEIRRRAERDFATYRKMDNGEDVA